MSWMFADIKKMVTEENCDHLDPPPQKKTWHLKVITENWIITTDNSQ